MNSNDGPYKDRAEWMRKEKLVFRHVGPEEMTENELRFHRKKITEIYEKGIISLERFEDLKKMYPLPEETKQQCCLYSVFGRTILIVCEHIKKQAAEIMRKNIGSGPSFVQ